MACKGDVSKIKDRTTAVYITEMRGFSMLFFVKCGDLISGFIWQEKEFSANQPDERLKILTLQARQKNLDRVRDLL